MNPTLLLCLRIGMFIMLLVCLLDMPYLYFQLVRSVGLIVFSLFAFEAYKQSQMEWIIFWLGSALIINPIFKVGLGRTLWNFVDVIWALIIISVIFQSQKENVLK